MAEKKYAIKTGDGCGDVKPNKPVSVNREIKENADEEKIQNHRNG